MNNLRENPDFDNLYRAAKYCYEIADPLLQSLPRTRASQLALVKFLVKYLTDTGTTFPISRQFVAEEIRCRDPDLVGNWTGTPNDIAWLMVHEDLSNYFVRFAMKWWNLQPYFIHHVPKSAGTSVCSAVYRQGFFVAYPETDFEVMINSRGLLGFAQQIIEFEEISRADRIYLGGHFNLPDMVASLGNFGSCRGVSLMRHPLTLLSSAIRYVWTKIEQDDPAWTAACPGLEKPRMKAVRKAISYSLDTPAIDTMGAMAQAIMASPLFKENYENIFVKYFYNGEIRDPVALTRFLNDSGDIVPCTEISQDVELISRTLGIDGDMPRENVSLLTHADLVKVFGGDQAFRATFAPRLLADSEIYGALSALRAQRA